MNKGRILTEWLRAKDFYPEQLCLYWTGVCWIATDFMTCKPVKEPLDESLPVEVHPLTDLIFINRELGQTLEIATSIDSIVGVEYEDRRLKV